MYRLLTSGEIIEAQDEYYGGYPYETAKDHLEEVSQIWSKIPPYHVGHAWNPGSLVPLRRKIVELTIVDGF